MMKRTHNRLSRLLGCLASVAAGLCAINQAGAQPFEALYGPGTTIERGYHGVEAVNNCLNGGNIAVGTRQNANGTHDVYVVRTNPNGTRMWEYTYDIAGVGGDDLGYSIAELPAGGFVLTGATNLGGALYDVFIMWLDCAGTMTTCNVYQGAPPINWPGNWVARDLVITASGDIVVAGWTTASPSGTVDGMMMRVTAAGGPLWRLIYDNLLGNDILYGVNEVVIGGAGDIIATGSTTGLGNGLQGWMLRTAPTGIIGAAPQGSAQIGGVGDEVFNSVLERGGNLVFLGRTNTNASAGLNDIYIVETGGYPCNVIADRQIGDANGNADDDYATDMAVVTNGTNPSVFPLGDLMVTGATTNNQGAGAYDAILLWLAGSPVNIPGPSFVFGDHATNPDVGFSISETDYGFIICGSSDFHPRNPADPGDMYLIRTNSGGRTCCEANWYPNSFVPGYPSTCFTSQHIYESNEPISKTVTRVSQNTYIKACTVACSFPKPGVIDEGWDLGETLENGMRVKLFPNPVAVGGSVTLNYPAEAESTATVTVTNALGEVVYSATVKAEGTEMAVSVVTTGWPAGSYLIRVESGSESDVIRMVVSE